MTVAPIPDDMIVLASRMDAFAIRAHLDRVRAMRRAFERARDRGTRTIGLDPGYPKPRHTTSFGDGDPIVESSQTRDINDVPIRQIRVFGSKDLYRAEYLETDTLDPQDVLGTSVDDAMALADRFETMLERATSDRERGPVPAHASIVAALSTHLSEAGLPHPTREFSLWTGAPYRRPSLHVRDERGDFVPIEGLDPTELGLWLPPVASFHENDRPTFTVANVRMRIRHDDGWRVDPMERLRIVRRRDETCSG